MIRRQLPAYSPLSFRALVTAAGRSLAAPNATRSELQLYLSERFQAGRVELTNSGTGALQLALGIAKAEIREPILVALPAYSCYDLATAVVGADARVVFYDLDPATLAPSRESLASALEHGPQVLVVANLFGFPVDWRTASELAQAAGALLVEDAAQGLGAGWQGKPAGTFGDLTVLSFGRGKGWTGGGGGALMVRGHHVSRVGRGGVVDPDRFGRGGAAWFLSLLQWALGRPLLYGIPSSIPGTGLGETHYREPHPARGISASSAALAAGTANAALEEVEVRKENARRIKALLATIPLPEDVVIPEPLPGGDSGYLRFPILIPPVEASRAHRRRTWRDLGLGRGYPKALTRLASLSRRAVPGQSSFPGAERLAAELVTLPLHSLLTPEDLERISQFPASLGGEGNREESS